MIARYANRVIIAILLLVFYSGCKKDNYSPPKSFLTGAILYEGDTLRFSNESALNLELWQAGFGKLTPIDVLINERGRFSTVLFDGEYKLDFPAGSYPFILAPDQSMQNDTISFSLKGSLNLDINVIPYYMFKDVSFATEGGELTANFGIDKVITDSRSKGINNIYLFVGRTRIVDNSNNIASVALKPGNTDDLGSIKMTTKIPKITPDQQYVFARIGLEISSVEQMVFSSVVKLDL